MKRNKIMMSSSQVRIHWFALLKIMKESGMVIEFHHLGDVLHLHVEDTHKHYKRPRQSKTNINPLTITTGKCRRCGELRFNDICINEKCPNSKPAVETSV